MKTSHAYLSVLMAGLLAAAGAQAQSTPAAGNSDVPPKAGEASTQTGGAPNALTTNSTASEAPISTKDALRQDAQGMNRAAATSSVPPRAGEASAMVRGKPNVDPNGVVGPRSRAEVRAEVMGNRAAYDSERRALLNQDTRLAPNGPN
ncbi:MAG: hypothetical protein JWQ07_2181 [Ramlibacter sp.]|nr:hypothetical protein [Ramlibacter sp.]